MAIYNNNTQGKHALSLHTQLVYTLNVSVVILSRQSKTLTHLSVSSVLSLIGVNIENEGDMTMLGH